MAKELKPGDEVIWNTSPGVAEGKVTKNVTSETRVKGHVAKPS